MGLCYTALSRTQSILDLLLQRPVRPQDFSTHISVLEAIRLEYLRLEMSFPQRITIEEVLQEAKLILRDLLI